MAVEEDPAFVSNLLRGLIRAAEAPSGQASWYLERIFRVVASERGESVMKALGEEPSLLSGMVSHVECGSVREILIDLIRPREIEEVQRGDISP